MITLKPRFKITISLPYSLFFHIPQHDVNLLKRHNSRKFKTPSFKWKKKKKNKVPYSPVPTPSAPDLTVDGSENPVDLTLDDNLDLEDSLRVEENPNEVT